MALWLARNPDIIKVVVAAWDWGDVQGLRRAINARHVMNNDTHRLLDADPPVPDDELPYWIWYPTVPSHTTLYNLAKARPAMRPQCVRASIATGSRVSYTRLMDMDAESPSDNVNHISPVVDCYVINEAKESPDRDFYVADLERRQRERGLTPLRYNYDKWKNNVPWKTGDMSFEVILGSLTDDGSCMVHIGQDWGMWEHLGSELGRVRLHLSTPLEERKRIRREEVGGIYRIPDP
jgi:hypothetical protein